MTRALSLAAFLVLLAVWVGVGLCALVLPEDADAIARAARVRAAIYQQTEEP